MRVDYSFYSVSLLFEGNGEQSIPKGNIFPSKFTDIVRDFFFFRGESWTFEVFFVAWC